MRYPLIHGPSGSGSDGRPLSQGSKAVLANPWNGFDDFPWLLASVAYHLISATCDGRLVVSGQSLSLTDTAGSLKSLESTSDGVILRFIEYNTSEVRPNRRLGIGRILSPYAS